MSDELQCPSCDSKNVETRYTKTLIECSCDSEEDSVVEILATLPVRILRLSRRNSKNISH